MRRQGAEGAARALCVFLRAPERGRVKTRLAATIGEEGALALYRAFLADTVAAAAEAARRSGALLELAVAGPLDDAAVLALADEHGASCVPQSDGDLGARMGAVIARHVAAGRAICIVGSDAPQLTGAQLARGLDALVGHEVVLGPSADGGYWLLGARRPIPELLEGMPWSQPSLLGVTLERLAGRSAALLEMAFDVDDGDDLALLRRWLGVASSDVAPATRRVLSSRALSC